MNRAIVNRMIVSNEIVSVLVQAGINETAVQHIWDRLVDGLSKDSEQELAALYAMLRPDDSKFIFIRDGRVSSPKEPGAIAYRRV
jgi:hypothetical protein|tara:strand:+ start:146 stop:400 length:255 start_codon:yes stop_codon:yes gene_type:complete